MTNRSEFIAGLHAFADWLGQNPQVRGPEGQYFLLALSTNQAVEEFADEHGLSVTVDSDGNASCDLTFGPITYHAYGYADFAEFCRADSERRARAWADRNDMVIQPREGGDES